MKAEELIDKLKETDYFANKEIAYAVLGATETNLPLLVEGDPGVGKTALAVALSKALNVPLIRVQCYEGISPDSILYDFDYSRMLLATSALRDKLNKDMADMDVNESLSYLGSEVNFYSKDFLLERPILKALTMPGHKVLLIDEIDKTSEEIEHTLLEVLSDFAMTIPEIGTVRCKEEDTPIVVLTSNRFRELSEPLKRRCVYLYMRQKSRQEIEDILLLKVSDDEKFCGKIADYLYQISQLNLQHMTSISEGITWAKFLKSSMEDVTDEAIKESIPYTVGFLAKDVADKQRILRVVFGIKE